MSTTVASLLSLPIFQNFCTLRAGSEGVENVVQYVTVMEAPDFNIASLTGNVMVLTTLSSHCQSTDEVNRVVRKLCEHRVSAICIKLGRFIDELEDSTIAIAEECQIPLFTTTREVLFREMIGDVLSAIVIEQQGTISELNELNDNLLQSILYNHGMDRILTLLVDKIPCNCFCLDHRGTVLARHASLDVEPDQKLVDRLLDKYQTKSSGKYVSMRDHYLFPCIAHGQTVGYLMVCAGKTIFENEMLFIMQAVSFLAIQFLEEHLRIETEQRMTASILDDILFVDHADEAIISDKLELLGISPIDHHLIMLISIRNDANTLYADSYLEYWRNWLRNRFKQFGVFIKGSDIVVIISYRDKRKLDFASLATDMWASVPAGLQKRLDIGFSVTTEDLTKLPECYSQAKRAANYGRSVFPDQHVFPYANFVGIGLVSHGVMSSDGEAVRARIVRPIQQYDARCNAQLWSTLERCLFSDNLNTAAKELHIHISTLRYRLQKIEQLTDESFFASKGRFMLQLGYFLHVSDSS